MHSAEYRRPEQISGRRVLIVGAGNSAGEISIELARAWCDSYRGRPVRSQRCTTSAARHTHPVPIGPRQSVAPRRCRASDDGHWCAARPARSAAAIADGCLKVPLIGLGLADALASRNDSSPGGLHSFTATGVRFADGSEESFDDVILATGYRAALGLLTGLIQHRPLWFWWPPQPGRQPRSARSLFRGSQLRYARGACTTSLATRAKLQPGCRRRRAPRRFSRTRCDSARTSTGRWPGPCERQLGLCRRTIARWAAVSS